MIENDSTLLYNLKSHRERHLATMLNYLRHHILRKSLWLMVLLGSLLTQTQNLYACELMGGDPQATCCCVEDMSKGCPMSIDGGAGCEIPDSGMRTGCCDVSTDISVGLADAALTDTHHYKQLLALDVPQPPLALIPIPDFTIPSSDVFDKFSVYEFALSERPLGTHTYLITSRFRI
ncbi:hypothetical protein MNBD_GAMMA21-1827 [hydrothermal vent metagenome]|uniref:Uncharacterized protein n=1 Tax=hydrothermal vent metagenome TaxID=652676 RepID=A0A3B0ZXU0_9ZZZZ